MIYVRSTKRSQYYVFVNRDPEEEEVQGNKKNSGVAGAGKLWERLRTLTADKQTLVTKKAALDLLLSKQKVKYAYQRSVNDEMTDIIDKLTGKVGQDVEKANQLSSENVDVMVCIAEMERVLGTRNEIFPNHMKIFSVQSENNPRHDIYYTVDRGHRSIFNLFRARLFPSASSFEKKRTSATVRDDVKENVIDLVNEDLNPAPHVQNSGRIQGKTVRALEEANYS